MNTQTDHGRQEPTRKPPAKIDLSHFSLICVIGQGSYAKVLLSRKKDTGKIYALKVLKKNKIEQKNQKNHIKTERNVLIEMKHPFIIEMMYAFQNENKLYFALEYCPGGELFNLLQQKRQFKEDHARFYIVQILLAMQHLHKHDIIYRDLKPENVLIDKDGYIRLTDFGLSKKGIKGNKGAHSACGTPEYLAPEILANVGHGKAVDWWTLGAILFEMLTGLPPFYTPNREELFEKIKFYALKYPPYLSAEAKSLLEGLFIKDPNQRLGGGPNDAEDVMVHPWFRDVDWNAYLRKQVQPPFMPIVKNELDVSNFDPEFTDAPVSSFGASTMMETSQNYPGWSYNGQESFQASEMERREKMETEEFEMNEKIDAL